MGVFTGYTINIIRNTKRGSDFWGKCEYCCKPAGEHWHARKSMVYQRENGRLYIGGDVTSSFGHEDCMRSLFKSALLIDNLELDGSIRLLPADWSIDDLSRHGQLMTAAHPFAARDVASKGAYHG